MWVLSLVVVLRASPAAGQGSPLLPCRFDAAPASVVFTGYTPFGAGAVATTTLSYDCPPPGTRAWIGISGARAMSSGANTLQFQLYQEATNSNVWTEAPPVPVPSAMNSRVTVFALLPPQDAAAGLYSTTLVVRLYSDAIGNETDARNLLVQANVAASCIIDPATLAFGTYDPLGASPLDAQATIRIACTRSTAWAVGLGTGNNPLGAMRQMANGPRLLQYQLYSDAGRTAPWDAIATVGGTAAGVAAVDLPVYGRVPAGQPAAAGTYQDVVQSTINF